MATEKVNDVLEPVSHQDVKEHHHPIHFFQNEKTIYLNPGALGCNNKPLAPYAVIQVKEEIKIEMRAVPYDNIDFLNSYEKLEVPEREFILKVFHGNQLHNN